MERIIVNRNLKWDVLKAVIKDYSYAEPVTYTRILEELDSEYFRKFKKSVNKSSLNGALKRLVANRVIRKVVEKNDETGGVVKGYVPASRVLDVIEPDLDLTKLSFVKLHSPASRRLAYTPPYTHTPNPKDSMKFPDLPTIYRLY